MTRTKEQLIAEIINLAPENVSITLLQKKSIAELEDILREALDEEQSVREDHLLRQQAQTAAAKTILDMNNKRVHEESERKQLPIDRALFSQAARDSGQFSDCDSNFKLVRERLGAGFRADVLVALATSGTIMLAPPSQEEVNQWRQDKIARYESWKKTEATTEQLRQVAKVENEVRAEQQKLSAFERELQSGYLREVIQGGKAKLPATWNGQPLDPTFIRKASKEVLTQIIRKHGSTQLSARLHQITRVPDGSGGYYQF